MIGSVSGFDKYQPSVFDDKGKKVSGGPKAGSDGPKVKASKSDDKNGTITVSAAKSGLVAASPEVSGFQNVSSQMAGALLALAQFSAAVKEYTQDALTDQNTTSFATPVPVSTSSAAATSTSSPPSRSPTSRST